MKVIAPAVALLLGILSMSARAEDFILVRDGQAACAIVISKDASRSVRRGAREIQSHLEQMSGAKLEIVTDDQPLPEHAILLGVSRHSEALGIEPDLEKLGNEGFQIKTVGPHLAIVGSDVRGAMYGCSELLEKLGVRWYTPKVTRVPQKSTVSLAALDETQIPAFEYREPFFTEAQGKDWPARLRINGHHTELDRSTGGKITYAHFVHTFDRLVPPELYAQHPEYFPLIEGKRQDGYVQRCLTNPDVLRLTIENVKQWIAEKPNATIFSVSQNDAGKWCECDQCKAITQKHGTHSGLYIWFVNQVAEAIEEDHPDKLIDTLAYQFTEAAPTGIAPRHNVRVRLCPIACCQAHPYEQCSHDANKAYLKALTDWGKLTDTLYIWHYNTNFANYLMPFPDFDEFPAEARLYKRSGVKGIFFQGDYAPGGGGSDAELRSYVMSKLLWNADADNDALVTEWMQGVYGKAWQPMRRWFDLLREKARDPNQHFTIYTPPNVHYMSADVLAEGDRLFDEAEKLAADDPTAQEYLAKARLSIRYVKLMQQPTGGEALDSFLADVRKFGITQLRESQPLEKWEQGYRKQLP